MKKIILIVLVLMCSYLCAQSKGQDWGMGRIWADSLNGWHDSTGGSWYRASDSVAVIEFQFEAQFPGGIAKDTGTVYVDTLKFYKGSIRLSSTFPYSRQDTIWSHSALPLKIDAWTVDTVLVLGGKAKHFTILEGNINLLKVVRLMTDGYGVGVGIKTDFTIEAYKDY